MRQLLNQMSAGFAMASGARGFFKARPLVPWFQPAGTIDATSVYDTGELKRTLERLVRRKARLIDQLDQLGAKRTYDFGFTQGWMCQSVRIREKSIHGADRAPLTGVRRDFL